MPIALESVLDSISLIVLALYTSQMIWLTLAPRHIPLVFDMLISNSRNPRGFALEGGIYTGDA